MKKNSNLQHKKEYDTKTLLPGMPEVQNRTDQDDPISPASVPNDELHPATAAQMEEIDRAAESSEASCSEENQSQQQNSRTTRSADDLKELSEFQKQPIDGRLTQVYTPRPLTPDDDVYEDVMEHFASTPTKPKYWFEEQGEYWSCSCGHINKGDRCGNCGLERELLRSLFILHKPEENSSAIKPITYTTFQPPEDGPKKAKASRKLKIAVIAAILALIACCGVAYFFFIAPALEEQKAQEKQNNKLLHETFEELQGLDEFREKGPLVRSSYIALGDKYYNEGKFQKAMSAYGEAQDLKKSDGLTKKINQAKFGYVDSNQHKKSNQVEAYMEELLKIDYPGIQAIYDAYYAWHVKIVTNLKEDDYSTDIESASRNDTVYFHIMLSGGKPSEEIDLYYEIVWPNGSSQVYNLDQTWKDGSKVTARFQYPIPLFGHEGKLTFNLYNKSSKEKMGSDSVMLQK